MQRVRSDMPGLRERHNDTALWSADSALLMTLYGASSQQIASYNSTTNLESSIVLQYPHVDLPPISLCSWVYPKQTNSGEYTCKIGPGAVGISVAAPINSTFYQHSLLLQVQIVDGSTPPRLLGCVDVTPIQFDYSRREWKAMIWIPFAAALGFLLLATIARVSTAVSSLRRKYGHAQLHLVLLVALSGHQLLRYPALRNFVWPGFGEVLKLAQFGAALILVRTAKPVYYYLLGQWASWSLLAGIGGLQFRTFGDEAEENIYNATSPLIQEPFASAMTRNSSSPLAMYPDEPSRLPNFSGTRHGFSAYARAAGVPLHGFFVRTMVVWFAMLAGVIAVSLVVLFIGMVLKSRSPDNGDFAFRPLHGEVTVDQMASYPLDGRQPSRTFWKRFSTHFAVLHGNMARLVMFFHLPITMMGAFGLSNSEGLPAAKIAPGITFGCFAVLLPGYLVWNVLHLPTNKLYNDRETFLMFGPLYNMYTPTREKFVAVVFLHSFLLGTVVGVECMSGSVQISCVFVIEVIYAILRLIWHPEGRETAAVPFQMLGDAIRVMLVLVSFVSQPRIVTTWHSLVRYSTVFSSILYACFHLLVLIWIFRVIELVLRIVYRISFDHSVSESSRGLFGVVRTIRSSPARKKIKGTRKVEDSNNAQDSSTVPFVPPNTPPQAHSRPKTADIIPLETLRGTPDPVRRGNEWTLVNDNDSDSSSISETDMWRTNTPSHQRLARVRQALHRVRAIRVKLPRSETTEQADAVLHDFLQDTSDSVSLAASTVSRESLYWLVRR
ncbi:hypothetical protein MCUN1_000488 [Malassezia cuniculi]|uniref:TRP C-terminal domain-containing protein n=1 Tax=Malassezia cuniculi TaxID=948313 RepID=A0AAF0J542_9BASI|nr:hypothetical protein MCUN1_000488 [Malassezia cuniculi]